jgi:hypothetical protein
VSPAKLFAFVQLDLPGRLGVDDGRYLVRAGEGGDQVLVVRTVGSPSTAARRRRRGLTRPADRDAEPPEIPLTRMTAIRPDELAADEAADWLARLRGDEERRDALVDEGVALINRVVHVQRAATHDPYVHEVSAARALALRAGYGSGGDLVDGRWEDALEIRRDERRRRRVDALRPQERLAAVLSGRDAVAPAETLLLRARLDLDQDRHREAALQLRAGLDALLAEAKLPAGRDDERDLAELSDLADLAERSAGVASAAAEAAGGELSEARAAGLADALQICERVLRRRRVLGA